MIKEVTVWKEGVLERNFRCPSCGNRVASTTGEYDSDNLVKRGKMKRLLCNNCLAPVAYIEQRDVPDGFQGDYDAYVRRKKGKK